jgi:hypothetical protein
MSIAPHWPIIRSNIASTCCSSETSAWMAMARPPAASIAAITGTVPATLPA